MLEFLKENSMSMLLADAVRDRRGATVVEFAFVAPLFLALMFGIVAFGAIVTIDNGLQQIVAEAARASVAGLTDAERAQLAQSSVTSTVSSYAFIDPARVTLSFDAPSATTFRVSVRYDMSKFVAYHLLASLPLPNPVVTRQAIAQRGGF